jgi:hypothetical protein
VENTAKKAHAHLSFVEMSFILLSHQLAEKAQKEESLRERKREIRKVDNWAYRCHSWGR